MAAQGLRKDRRSLVRALKGWKLTAKIDVPGEVEVDLAAWLDLSRAGKVGGIFIEMSA